MKRRTGRVLDMHHGDSMSENLGLDDQTFKDLEVFSSAEDDVSLFGLCNRTRTDGGAKELRRRMRSPWASSDKIRDTQDAIRFILDHRSCFARLPSAYAMGRVERYSHQVLPIVTETNPVEFGLGALTLWGNHDRHYMSIALGVQVTCRMVQGLRQFVAQPALDAAAGELAPRVVELRALLDQPGIAAVPEEKPNRWFWQVLRLDQSFRLFDKDSIVRLLELVFEIDALMAMADTTDKHGFVIPDIKTGEMSVQAIDLVHPFLEHAVPNDAKLDQRQRVLFLTGPNMAGKTTYLRAFATAVYLAHLGMGVPARQFSFVPAERLFSSISLSDDIHAGVSYFRAEALRARSVAAAVAAGYRVIALMDEPFKGTNVKDALDASLAIIKRLATRQDCLFIFSSHLIELSDELDDTGQVDCRNFEADETEGRLRFDYLLRPGVSRQRLGMRVLEEEGVFDLLDGNDANPHEKSQ